MRLLRLITGIFVKDAPEPIDRSSLAFLAGRRDFSLKRECPYAEGTEARREWEAGYRDEEYKEQEYRAW